MKKKKIRGIIRTVVVFLSIFIILSILFVMFTYESVFKAYRAEMYTIFPEYDALSELYVTEDVVFASGGTNLSGKLYSHDSPKGLVIMTHNKDASSRSLMGIAKTLLEANYSVFMFDLTGHAMSAGDSQVGLCRPAEDMSAAVEYALGNPTLKDLPLLLYGQGMGGYGACAVMDDYPEVKAAVSVSAYGNSADMLLEYSVTGMSVFGAIEYPITAAYNLLVFGSMVSEDAVDGINGSASPVMIIHGKEDKTVKNDGAALINYNERITNPGAVYLEAEERGHNNTLYSDAAMALNKEYENKINNLYDEYNNNPPIDKVKEIVEEYKGFGICETDPDISERIIAFYDNAVA